MSDVIDREKLNAIFEERMKQAETILSETGKVQAALDEADRNLYETPVLKNAMPEVSEMLGLARSIAVNEYVAESDHTMKALIGAFLYLNEKSDAIADSVPVIGYLDDLAVLGTALEVVKDELAAYRAWKAE